MNKKANSKTANASGQTDERSCRPDGTDGFSIPERFCNILSQAKIGFWCLEIQEGQPLRMSSDRSLLALLGAEPDLAPEEQYLAWHRRIDEGDVANVDDALHRMVQGHVVQIRYLWHHPTNGPVYVCGTGSRREVCGDRVLLEGIHQDLSELMNVRQEFSSLQGNIQKERLLEQQRMEERKKILETLAHARDVAEYEADFVNHIINSMPMPCFVKDVENGFRYVRCNAAYAQLHNLNENDIIGKTDVELFGPEVAERSFTGGTWRR